jgi:hypothetical protein
MWRRAANVAHAIIQRARHDGRGVCPHKTRAMSSACVKSLHSAAFKPVCATARTHASSPTSKRAIACRDTATASRYAPVQRCASPSVSSSNPSRCASRVRLRPRAARS